MMRPLHSHLDLSGRGKLRSGRNRGFSLIEIAIVLMVIGALLGGLILPLSSQQDASKRRETNQLLDDVEAALLGFAAANGRLPCPATTGSAGQAAPNAATTTCTTWSGFVPARTLGVAGPTDGNNLLTDRWLRPLRYSLSSAEGGVYASAIPLNPLPDLVVCSDNACGTPIADRVVAVVFSQNENIANSPDQSENTDGDAVYVSRTESEATGAEFDDTLRWISPNTLVYQLVRAGRVN
jgi:prepilin-type N-terminal cleavage/methylation domain-containing protein